jgi:putative copper resistance protein D
VNKTTPTAPRIRAALGFFALLAFAVAATVLGLRLGGGAAPSLLQDSGAVVRWGLPLIKGLTNISMAVTIGSLAMACFATGNSSWQLRRMQNLAALAASLWAVSGTLVVLFTYLSVTGLAFSTSDAFGSGIWMFVTSIALGQSLSLNVLFGGLVAIAVLMAEKLNGTLLALVLAVGGLIPLAVSGHASGTQGHSMAVNAIGLHLLAVTVWVGGLVALLALKSNNVEENRTLVGRYSSLALMAYLIVAASGVASATVRITSFSQLTSGYGQLVLLKSVTLLALGVFGALYRVRLFKRAKGITNFWSLPLAELALMGVAMGLASALARTAPPEKNLSLVSPTPAQILTGSKLPPELTPERWLSAYKIDLIWLLVCVFGIVLYLFGVWRLKRRGDSWPVVRTLSWLAGMLALLWITNGSMNVYEEYLFSVHMIAHMMLTMAVPVLLVPGAPITLLSRAVAKRNDGTSGVREWALWAVHTPWARLVSNPIFAAVNFATSLAVFYFTPLFSWATHDHLGHEWMIVHFLITGYLFVQALVGIDPGPKPFPHAVRLIILLGTLTFHALFGLALMQGHGLLLANWFGAMGRIWGQDPLADQQTGGAIAWGIGEFPAAILTLIVSVQWSRSDAREARRTDRASDRAGNQDLQDYNQMLENLAARRAQAQQRHDNRGGEQ